MSLELTYGGDKLAKALDGSATILRQHVGNAVLRGVSELAREARSLAPKGHTVLTNSINQRMVGPMEGEVVAGSAYARMVEEGTGPGGWPSERTMLDWIAVHNIQPRDPGMDVQDLAYVMAKDIAMHGTPAQPFMAPAFDNKKARVQMLIDQALDAALREMGK